MVTADSELGAMVQTKKEIGGRGGQGYTPSLSSLNPVMITLLLLRKSYDSPYFTLFHTTKKLQKH